MTTWLLLPGDLIARAAGLSPSGESAQILRMFANTIVYGAIGSGLALMLWL